jgi:hypothetical protein
MSSLSFFPARDAQKYKQASSSSSSGPYSDAIETYAVPVAVTTKTKGTSAATTETVYRNAAHKDQLLRGFPFPNDDCKTLGDIWESAFKKYPNRPLLGCVYARARGCLRFDFYN